MSKKHFNQTERERLASNCKVENFVKQLALMSHVLRSRNKRQ